MTKMEEAVRKWHEVMTFAIGRGEGEAALLGAHRIMDLVELGFKDAIAGTKICELYRERLRVRIEEEAERLKIHLSGGDPTPMCKMTPEAIEDHCPTCGCKTDRVEPDPLAVQGSDLGRPKFVCPKCEKGEVPSSYCWRCTGRGWTKGLSPGGSRIIREKCEVCEGTGKR